MKRKTSATVGAILVAAAVAAVPAVSASVLGGKSKELRRAVGPAGIFEHLQAFQNAASANGDTRVTSSPGFVASVDYVVSRLKAAGYAPTVQAFEYPFFEETAPATFARTAPSARTYVLQDDFATMDYSGSGDVTATVQAVDLVLPPGPAPSTSNSGCEAADFAGFTAGSIALMQRGTCSFAAKAANAQAAGAVAAVIFNEGQPGRVDTVLGTLGGPGVTIPTLGTSFAVGEELAGLTGAVVHITTATTSEIRIGNNVLADIRARKAGAKTIVVGGHLDSVPEGPGINDNGSGTATILEIAEAMASQRRDVRQNVRFAFWGAEEFGLLGSQHYVDNLTEAELADIGLNLNFDMLGSPNFARFVYDGDGSDTPDAGPAGSAEIEATFGEFFTAKGLATSPTAFDGRSDYRAFILAGIPAGGLFSGAEGVKTADDVVKFGGVLGEAYDRCYHQACDTLSNVNRLAVDQMSDAATHTVARFAFAKTLPGAVAPAAAGAARTSAPTITFDRKGPHFVR